MISDPAVLHSTLAIASFHFDFVSFWDTYPLVSSFVSIDCWMLLGK